MRSLYFLTVALLGTIAGQVFSFGFFASLPQWQGSENDWKIAALFGGPASILAAALMLPIIGLIFTRLGWLDEAYESVED